MKTDKMIPVIEFCTYHDIDLSFIHSQNESGLIDIICIENEVFVSVSQLKQLEKLMRLKKEMDIDLDIDGIDTITYLIERIHILKNRF